MRTTTTLPALALLTAVASYPITRSPGLLPPDTLSPPTLEVPLFKRMTPSDSSASSSYHTASPSSSMQYPGPSYSSDHRSSSFRNPASPTGSHHSSTSQGARAAFPHTATTNNDSRDLPNSPSVTSAQHPNQAVQTPRDRYNTHRSDRSLLGKSKHHLASFDGYVRKQGVDNKYIDDSIKLTAMFAHNDLANVLDSGGAVVSGRAPNYYGEDWAGRSIPRGHEARRTVKLVGKTIEDGLLAGGVAAAAVPYRPLNTLKNTTAATAHLISGVGYRLLHHAQSLQRSRSSSSTTDSSLPPNPPSQDQAR